MLEAMLGIAGLFVAQGNLAFARSVLLEAASLHPQRADVWTLLGNALVDLEEPEAARTAYERAAQIDPDLPVAQLGLAVLDERAGDGKAARAHWRRGYARGVPSSAQWLANPSATRILVVSSAIGGNVPILPILDDPRFVRAEIFAEGYAPSIPLPRDALVVNAIGDADRCVAALDHAERLIADVGSPVVNLPSRVRATTRLGNAQRFAELPRVRAPRTAVFSRCDLVGPEGAGVLASAGFAFPLLLRVPGFHTGRHFERVETPGMVSDVAQALPGDEVLAIEFVDTASPDGSYHKYRVLTIAGVLYPLHLAVSSAWKVHYFSAAMADRADYREQEAAFLHDARVALGAAAYATLERVAQALGLDYAGIDFGVDDAGRIVVFEANATMLIAPVGNDPRFAYRVPAAAAAIEASRVMLVRAAGQHH
jgi:tetratricopeptide (TPR) repeat protein